MECVIMYCLVRVMCTSRDGDRCVWSNGEIVIIRGKPKKQKGKPAPVQLLPHESYMKPSGIEPEELW
jgi:hypothetical protein